MSTDDQPAKRPRGRPAGSGAQQPPQVRARQSRENRAGTGATRLDFSLDPASSGQLVELMELWNARTRKEAVQHALSVVYQTVNPTFKGGA
ncbi:hypothetical protein [Massilia scottii]|uniref:hypothetical protein n=1 Tax=Massilia scottii TaxID=3057166 RepID=UPI0027964F81|nr:hypothetical protein [Massilia sp. CCM 9029]MDQ1835191.1 hypothetical protein [Massilia sp. CCM 9029]